MCDSTSDDSNQPCCDLRIAWTRKYPEGPGLTAIPPESGFTSRSTVPDTVSDRSNDPSAGAAQAIPLANVMANRARTQDFIECAPSGGLSNQCTSAANAPAI